MNENERTTVSSGTAQSGPADRAPDIGPNYPSRGERLGPAWQLTWDLLADGEWRGREDLARQVAAESDVVPITASNLIKQACAVDLLEHRVISVNRQATSSGAGRRSGARQCAQVRRVGSPA